MRTPAPRPCAEWEKLLAAVFPADLAPEDRAALEAHLAICPACAAVRADYQRMDAQIRRLPDPRPLPGLPPRLVACWAEEERLARSQVRILPSQFAEDVMRMKEETGAAAPAPHPLNQSHHTRRRLISGISAVAAVLIIVTIIVALFASRAAHPSKTGNQSAQISATPTSSFPGKWTPVAGLTNLDNVPILAPTNPQVAYQAILLVDNKPAPLSLRRTDDGGATWHNLPVPGGITTVDWAGFFVSPFSAQQVFLEINARCPTSYATITAPAGGLSSGAKVCTQDYFSSDSGAHWSRVQWPTRGDDTRHTRLGAFYTYSPFKTQGHRLYALLGTSPDGNASSLITSTDGGRTWKFADQSIVAQGDCVYDYAPTPAGSTLFAITVSPCVQGTAHLNSYASQHGPAVPAAGGGGNALWSSNDAGASWTRVGPFAPEGGNGVHDLVARLNSAGQPVLYDDGFAPPNHTFPPTVTKASTDGGKTWRAAPAGITRYANSGLLGTLSDGSIIEAFYNELFAWKAGDASWHQISPGFDDAPQYLLVVPSGGSGHDTLWLVTNASGTYSVQSFTLR